MANGRRLISFIIPVFNEEGNIPLLYQELREVLNSIWGKYDCEVIFVNDGSSDGSDKAIKNITRQNKRVKYIEFSRNFGKEIATTAGLNYARGDAVVILDADLQHPPQLIPQFVSKWEEGNEVVIGVRNSIKSDRIKKIGSLVFYRLINTLGSDINLMPFATDFRLLDKKVVREFNKFTERARMTRGLVNWLGFKREFIYFDAPARNSGKASYGLLKLIRLAMSSIVSHSLFPLKLAGYLGVLIVFTIGPFGLYVLLGKYFFNWAYALSFSGPAQLAFLTIFLVGVILSCLGMIALYVANIHEEILNRPIYVVRDKENIE